MRISDWSSDVCSSDLSPSVLQQIAEYLVDFARLKSQAPSLKEEPVPQTPPFPIWRQRHSQSANPRIHMVQSRCVGPIQSRRDSKPNISSAPVVIEAPVPEKRRQRDRKSTRLNSSH